MEITPESVDKFEELLKNEREEWGATIKSIIPKIRHISDLAETQVKMLSARHLCVDKVTDYKTHVSKRKNLDSNYKKMRIEYYKTNRGGHQVKYDDREIREFIVSDMASRTRYREALELQVGFFYQVIETLDKMGFSIKNRIEIESMSGF